MCGSGVGRGRGVDAREDAATVVGMLFLIACSSIALDDSAPALDDGADVAAANADALKYAACYATCETFWVPAPECELFYTRQEEWNIVTVEDCQSECALATIDSDRDGIPWYDEWPENVAFQMPGFGCETTAMKLGSTPCDLSATCVEE